MKRLTMSALFLTSLLTLFLTLTFSLCAAPALAASVSNFSSSQAANGLIDSSSVQVDMIKQNPDSARPGEPLELTFSVQNVGNENLKNIAVEVQPEYPFSALSGEALKKEIAFLNARQETEDAGTLKFKVLTDPNASEGTYKIDVTTTAEPSDGSSETITTTRTFEIEVKGKEYAQIVTINTAGIDLGKEEPLQFIITNTGSSPLKNLVFSWKDPKGVVLPVRSDNTRYVKYLDAGDSITLPYSVIADINANPGLYTLNINLEYENYESKTNTVNTTAGLFVGGKTDFDVSFSESSAGKLSLSVANVGNNVAYSVKVKIPGQTGFNVQGSPSSIVGNLEKGDYTITSFDVSSAKAAGQGSGNSSVLETAKAAIGNNGSSIAGPSENQNLKVQIEYTDAKGERLTVDKEVPVQLNASSGGPGAYENKGNSSSSLSYLLILAVAAGGFFLYRRKKQGKNSKDKKL